MVAIFNNTRAFLIYLKIWEKLLFWIFDEPFDFQVFAPSGVLFSDVFRMHKPLFLLECT